MPHHSFSIVLKDNLQLKFETMSKRALKRPKFIRTSERSRPQKRVFPPEGRNFPANLTDRLEKDDVERVSYICHQDSIPLYCGNFRQPKSSYCLEGFFVIVPLFQGNGSALCVKAPGSNIFTSLNQVAEKFGKQKNFRYDLRINLAGEGEELRCVYFGYAHEYLIMNRYLLKLPFLDVIASSPNSNGSLQDDPLLNETSSTGSNEFADESVDDSGEIQDDYENGNQHLIENPEHEMDTYDPLSGNNSQQEIPEQEMYELDVSVKHEIEESPVLGNQFATLLNIANYASLSDSRSVRLLLWKLSKRVGPQVMGMLRNVPQKMFDNNTNRRLQANSLSTGAERKGSIWRLLKLCPICIPKFNTLDQYYEHVEEHHPDLPIACNHALNVKGNYSFCDICPYASGICDNSEQLAQHVYDAHYANSKPFHKLFLFERVFILCFAGCELEEDFIVEFTSWMEKVEPFLQDGY